MQLGGPTEGGGVTVRCVLSAGGAGLGVVSKRISVGERD